jgi:hypothetical protein
MLARPPWARRPAIGRWSRDVAAVPGVGPAGGEEGMGEPTAGAVMAMMRMMIMHDAATTRRRRTRGTDGGGSRGDCGRGNV